MSILYGHFNSLNCCLYRDVYQELYSGGNDRNVLMWTPNFQSEDCDDKYEGSSRRNPMIRTLDNWSSDED